MQFLRVYARQITDVDRVVKTVEPYEAGLLVITEKGERILSIHALPGIRFHVLTDDEVLPVIS
jgi:hypothetical protein